MIQNNLKKMESRKISKLGRKYAKGQESKEEDLGHARSYVSLPISVTSYPGRTKGGSLLNVAH